MEIDRAVFVVFAPNKSPITWKGKPYFEPLAYASDLESGNIGEEEDEMDPFYRERIDEFEKGWDDFFEDRPAPESEEESLDMQEEFIQWYNTERKQSPTGITPEDMDMKFAFEREEPYMERLRKANACIGREEFTTAGEIADEVLERDPENKMALQISMRSKIMGGDLDRAEKVLDRWESLDNEDPYTFLHRALLCIINMDLQSALEEVDKALKTEPKLFDAVVLKAQLLDLLDDERAEKAVEKARELDESHTEMFLDECWITDYVGEDNRDTLGSKLQRVFSLIRSGETERARELIPEIREMDIHSEMEDIEETIDRVEFDTLLREGKIDEVDEKVAKKLESEPKNTLYFYYSAQVSYLRGDMEEALQRINECISVIEEKEDDAESMFPFEFLSFKAEILRVIGDENWKRWHQKAERSRGEAMKKLEGSFKETDMIRVSEESKPQEQSEKEEDRKEERKEKTLDEFL